MYVFKRWLQFCFCQWNPLKSVISIHFSAHHPLLSRQFSSSSASSFVSEWGNVTVSQGHAGLYNAVIFPQQYMCVGSKPVRLLLPLDYVLRWIFLAHSKDDMRGFMWRRAATGTAQPCMYTPPCMPYKAALKFDQPSYLHLYGWDHLLWGGIFHIIKSDAASNGFQNQHLIQ